VPAPPPAAEDMCNPADYEGFKEQDLKDMWKDCCDNAKQAGVADPDCARPQW